MQENRQDIMVSVICPTYNQAAYIRKGLDSILMQKTDFRYEVLIGEDCSPDNTNEILAEYEEKYPELIQVFHREKNLKQSKNVYDLFMRSKGKYIIILDLDDYWTDEKKLQIQVDFLETHPEYIGVAHYFSIVDANDSVIEKEGREICEYLDKEFTLQDFLERGFVYQTGTFCYHNIWREDKDWSIIHTADTGVVDLTINLVLLQRKPVYIMSRPMSVYREVVDPNALNFRSVCVRDRALDVEKMTKQLERLNDYFGGSIDLSEMWSEHLLSYMKGIARRESENFKIGKWLQIYKKATKKSREKFRKEIAASVKRKMGIVKSNN